MQGPQGREVSALRQVSKAGIAHDVRTGTYISVNYEKAGIPGPPDRDIGALDRYLGGHIYLKTGIYAPILGRIYLKTGNLRPVYTYRYRG